MRQLLSFIVIISIPFLFLNSCKKEEFETGKVNLAFSEDTILFDTVFTTVGSSTQVFSVYNTGGNPVKISNITLANGGSSNFRLNVDGVAGKSFNNVEIGANDSIFIFVEVTVDPNNQLSPVVITDAIVFTTNGNEQQLPLVAWGQDAYYHRPPANSHIAPYFFADTINQSFTWANDKPHVIYGYAMIDSSQTLTIPAGTKIYLHPGSGIIVLSSGTLLVNGTLHDSVTFQGDRLGVDFQDVPGQWDRIWISNLNLRSNQISPSSKNCSIKYAVIKNGTIGLLVDTVPDANPNNPTLNLENTIVKNMSSHALALRGSRVNAYNSVFANCGAQTTNILYGGGYKFYHCTFANFWNNSVRQDPAVSLNNYYNVVRTLDAYFGNCILYGSNDNELGLDSFPTANQFNFRFDHSLIKVESAFPTSNTSRYINIIKSFNGNNNPNFVDIDNNNYQLDSISPAVDAGDSNILTINPSVLGNDILGIQRSNTPDLGAYERR